MFLYGHKRHYMDWAKLLDPDYDPDTDPDARIYVSWLVRENLDTCVMCLANCDISDIPKHEKWRTWARDRRHLNQYEWEAAYAQVRSI